MKKRVNKKALQGCSFSSLPWVLAFCIMHSLAIFSGACETGLHFPPGSCNGKIISAKYFSAGAHAIATFNASVDFLSPFDADGHGR